MSYADECKKKVEDRHLNFTIRTHFGLKFLAIWEILKWGETSLECELLADRNAFKSRVAELKDKLKKK